APVPAPAGPAARVGALRVRDPRRCRPGQGPHRVVPPDRRHDPLAEDEGLPPRRRARAGARRLRPDPVRPGLPAGPPPGARGGGGRRGPPPPPGDPPTPPPKGP